MKNVKVLKGNMAFSISPGEIKTFPQSYIVVENGIVEGIYKHLPEEYRGNEIFDYGDSLIIPGFVDLHVHAPQYYQRGLGMDMELFEWLEKYTFHQEAQFSDLEYAREVYSHFAEELIRRGTLCASIYATIHKPATELLFEILSNKGIRAFVGKVNMDRNCPDGLKEDTKDSLRETEDLIEKYMNNTLVKPILTPRFVPTCSDDLLEGLGELAIKFNIPVQSHLSENWNEVKWVKELHHEGNYTSVYYEKGLLGHTPTLMAHCIHLNEEEIELISKNDVIAVHCPESNLNLGSGIMPVRKMLKKGVSIGLGSDVGAGHDLSMANTMVRAIQLSKVAKVFGPEQEQLTFEETFHMATKGGGSFFGNAGSFENGYMFDALVIDDTGLGCQNLSVIERLKRFVYVGDDRNITARFVQGRKLWVDRKV